MSAPIPESRQEALRSRLMRGMALELSAIAREFDVSVDTVRRDLQLLERQGVARRVRGGAMPVIARPVGPAIERMERMEAAHEALALAALPLIEDGMVLMLDGGATVLSLAQSLPTLPNALVVTPAPAVALACLASGIETQLIGGRVSESGAISVGHGAVAALTEVAADLAILGVCGLDVDFGLGADEMSEAEVKRAMVQASHRCVAITSAAKLGRRARHRIMPAHALDILIADADKETGRPFEERQIEVIYA